MVRPSSADAALGLAAAPDSALVTEPAAIPVARPAIAPGWVLLASVLAISWAAPLIRWSDAPALAISFWRLAFSVGLIGAVLLAGGEWRSLRGLRGADWGLAIAAGVLLAGHFAAWISSVGLTSVAASVALVSTGPIWVALGSALLLGERPSPRQWLGIVLAVAGAAWVGWGDVGGGRAPLLGDALALLGALLVAGYYLIGRRLRARLDIWPYTGLVYGAAALVLLAALLASRTPVVGYGRSDWMIFAGLALGPMMIGHTGQNWALRYLPAHVVNLSLLGEPVGAALLAWALPGIREVPSANAVLGGALILSGLALGLPRRKKR